MTPTEQAEAELTEKFIQHHTLDDSQNSYVHNGQWAYSQGYRAGLKQAASPKREWVGTSDLDRADLWHQDPKIAMAALEQFLKLENA